MNGKLAGEPADGAVEDLGRFAIVGQGRLGTALAAALGPVIDHFDGPFGRKFDGRDRHGRGYDVVLLAVPDAQIAAAAAAIRQGPIVGHCAGAIGLDVLGPHESFGLHPLMTVTNAGATFAGAGAAVAGSTPRALGIARQLAHVLEMSPVEIRDGDRAAYHAAASMAANLLVTLEDAAETLLATTGAPRAILVPLARAALDNWATAGGREALTGPVARGDEETVQRQRAAIAERTPQLLAMFDALVDLTRALAQRPHPGGAEPASPAGSAG